MDIQSDFVVCNWKKWMNETVNAIFDIVFDDVINIIKEE